VSRARLNLVEESWSRTLARIPTTIGRLAYLASLRNANTGTYSHFGIAQRAGREEVDRIARQSHSAVFQEWLGFDLGTQKEQIEIYLAEQEGDRAEIVAAWSSLQPFSSWIPAETRDVERRLFESDLGTVLELLRADYDVVPRDPDS